MREAPNQRWHKEVMPERWNYSMRSKIISQIRIITWALSHSALSNPSLNTKNLTPTLFLHYFYRKKQANAHELLPVLAEVLKALLSGTGLEVVNFLTKWDNCLLYCFLFNTFIKFQNLVAGEDFTDRSGLLRYNILPLHPKFSQRPIMLLPEVCQFFFSKFSKIKFCRAPYYVW